MRHVRHGLAPLHRVFYFGIPAPETPIKLVVGHFFCLLRRNVDSNHRVSSLPSQFHFGALRTVDVRMHRF